MVGEVLRGLEARFPRLVSWFGGRMEIELPALLLSLTIHGFLLVGLAFAGYQVHQEVRREFRSGLVVDNMVSSESTYQDLDQTAGPPATVAAAGSFTPTLASSITSAPSSAGVIPVTAASQAATGGMAPELVKIGRAPGNRAHRAHGDHARTDCLDQGQWRRIRRWR